jgi:hypothetical protein
MSFHLVAKAWSEVWLGSGCGGDVPATCGAIAWGRVWEACFWNGVKEEGSNSTDLLRIDPVIKTTRSEVGEGRTLIDAWDTFMSRLEVSISSVTDPEQTVAMSLLQASEFA